MLEICAEDVTEAGDCLLRESVPSRPDVKEAVVDRWTAALREREFVCEDDETWLQLCLEEAVVNAMLHGNEGDPDLPVELSLWQIGDRWRVIIRDEGNGFGPDDVPDMDGPDALLREHGRGIALMQDWLDELTYYRNGATVAMGRRIGAGSNGSDSSEDEHEDE